jgi:hypothetical protein
MSLVLQGCPSFSPDFGSVFLSFLPIEKNIILQHQIVVCHTVFKALEIEKSVLEFNRE